jgi:peptide/nickel transport system substrate-binding protein
MLRTCRAGLAIATIAFSAAIALVSSGALAAPAKGGAANIAMIGEPQTLDPMASTADLVGTIMLHVYELLYTFDANWNVTPMLAESLPTISNGDQVYTIALRKGVKFHNGHEMSSDDVLASLKRWMDTAPRGKAVGGGEDDGVHLKAPRRVGNATRCPRGALSAAARPSSPATLPESPPAPAPPPSAPAASRPSPRGR